MQFPHEDGLKSKVPNTSQTPSCAPSEQVIQQQCTSLTLFPTVEAYNEDENYEEEDDKFSAGDSGRKQRFSPQEKQISVEEVSSHYEDLFGRESDRVPLSIRKQIWRNFCHKINACRRLVKAKLSKIHKHCKQTTSKKLTALEEMMADTLHREQIEGIGNYDLMAGLQVNLHGSKEDEESPLQLTQEQYEESPVNSGPDEPPETAKMKQQTPHCQTWTLKDYLTWCKVIWLKMR
ncbi:uncharacterized protein LOC130303199 isoform X2 [Hyla sarda]|uniref:uncharacterized protein LOC130303199 isoform X2 n=1 Tax=Hyla sarda TaxID=327740 RepID=UPI0024C2F1B2|nr:uncharacterized protein LOC130303199 isoform X2 [Hyla sarda]